MNIYSFSQISVSAMYLWIAIPQVREDICEENFASQKVSNKYPNLDSSARNVTKPCSFDDDKLIKFIVSAKEAEKNFLKQLEELRKGDNLKTLEFGDTLAVENQKFNGEDFF